MKIKVSQNIPSSPYSQKNMFSSYISKDESGDNFISLSNKNSCRNVSFSSSFFSSLFKPKTVKNTNTDNSENKKTNDYKTDISEGVERVMECGNIPPENFDCVLTPQEIKQILPSLSEENFISSKDNIKNGIYIADLDNQTTYSKYGDKNIFDVLKKALQFANTYHEETGKDFILAITDVDSLEGVQHALRIAGSNPEKYKHLKIVPGIKMSYTHKAPNSDLGYENSNILIYGINPFSSNIIDFVDTTLDNRREMVAQFIKEVKELYPELDYNVGEFTKQNGIKYKKGFGQPNLYWRTREYAEKKGDTKIKGTDILKDNPTDIIYSAKKILDELDIVFLGSEKSEFSGLGSDIITDEEVNKNIKAVFEKYSTHEIIEDGKTKVVSSAENFYDEMINCLSKEPEKPILAVASPYYLSHYFEKHSPNNFAKVVGFLNKLQDESNGMLLAFESVSPEYKKDKYLTEEQIKAFNDYIRANTNLSEVGGSSL